MLFIQLDLMDPAVKAHTQLVQFKMPKPANLPFHLLAWAAEYVKNYNCGLMLHEKKEKKSKRKLGSIKNKNKIDNKLEYENSDDPYIRRILKDIMTPISNIVWNFVPTLLLKPKVEEKVEEKVEKVVTSFDVNITSTVPVKTLTIPVEPDGRGEDVLIVEKSKGASLIENSIGVGSADIGVGAKTLPHDSHDRKVVKLDNNMIGISENIDVDVSSSKLYSSDHPLMAVCGVKGTAQHRGAVINMTYFRPSIIHNVRYGNDSQYENMFPTILKSPDTGRVSNKKTKTQEKNIKRTAIEERKVKNEEILEKKFKDKKENPENEIEKTEMKVERIIEEKVKVKAEENNRKTHSDWTRKLKLKRKRKHDIVPIQYIYYTECDQIVKYDTMGTLEAFSSALNESTFLTGRRKEKSPDTSAIDYMGGVCTYARFFVCISFCFANVLIVNSSFGVYSFHPLRRVILLLTLNYEKLSIFCSSTVSIFWSSTVSILL